MASQGPNSPGTAANDNSNGGSSWYNPELVVSSNEEYAEVSSYGSTITTSYLKVNNFGFSIPSGAVIDGIFVEIQKLAYYSNGTAYDNIVKIIKADGSYGSQNKGKTSTLWPTEESYISYGSSSDLWNETWAATDINDSDFGIIISGILSSGTKYDYSSTFINHIRITVYYTEGSSSAIKTINGLAKASVKTVNGLAIASVKSWNGLQ